MITVLCVIAWIVLGLLAAWFASNSKYIIGTGFEVKEGEEALTVVLLGVMSLSLVIMLWVSKVCLAIMESPEYNLWKKLGIGTKYNGKG